MKVSTNKRIVFISLGLLLIVCVWIGQSHISFGTLDGQARIQEEAASNDKIRLTLMIAGPEDVNSEREQQMVARHFADRYDLTFKTWEASNAEKVIKTSIASEEPLDLAMYWPGEIDRFANGDLALDLTPYLEANDGQWKATFIEGVLGAGTYKEKVFAVPNAPIYPLLEVNMDILDQAGIRLSGDTVDWNEFKQMLQTIKEQTGIRPLGIQKNWTSWPVRELLYSVWPDESKLLEWSQGKIPFTDPNVVRVFQEVESLYTNGYVYPGQGALTMSQEQIDQAFDSGQIAVKANLNVLSAQSIRESGLEHVRILSWPHMGTRTQVLGGFNGYMIPVNARHPEVSIEILKYLTSPEVLQHRVNNGAPVAIKGVMSDDPEFSEYAKDIANFYQQKEILSLSSSISQEIGDRMPANFLFYGMKAIEDLEKLRLDAQRQ
ncbi:extracellular solute-binding protein [Saccharibacillus sp. CPCC 101409]|uniref:ABC transporter substrate-binding protein n=1 Tax=Saccharibacillus sp. CPCC 101409 TaxID=3058041 RepID=UPI0026710F89|nr:extracellular solute-binding protein [Saccharibacillus sp. CPCC 101409]MDO3411918.1 extracellular solute-binding protein [Saccharibacillus sp. CPCC 101409]